MYDCKIITMYLELLIENDSNNFLKDRTGWSTIKIQNDRKIKSCISFGILES